MPSAYTASNILNPGILCDAFNSLYFLSIHIPRQKLEIPTAAVICLENISKI